MAMKITEKMKGFINEYKNFEREGVKRLKNIIKWDGKKELKEIDGKYMYLTTFSDMDTINLQLYCASNTGKIALVREFDTSKLSDKVNEIVDGPYKVFGISNLWQLCAGTEKCKTGIYFDNKITLVILTKYGTFKILEYLSYSCDKDEKIAEIMNAVVGNKEITILPSSNSEFYSDCQTKLADIIQIYFENDVENITNISFKDKEYIETKPPKILESSVYVDGKFLFSFSNCTNVDIVDIPFMINNRKGGVYNINIAGYDFFTGKLDLVDIGLSFDDNISENEFYTLDKNRVCDISFEELGMEKGGMEAVTVKDADIINKLIQL